MPDFRDVLSLLSEGNARFVSGMKSVSALASAQRLKELAEKGQKPFACVLSCADSRVPVELVFDCGVGDLFVCRLAGNLATSEVIASFEYAVLHLGTPLIAVVGHSRCGAVQAALSDPKGLPSKHLKGLVAGIEPAESVDQASRKNVRAQCARLLAESEILRQRHEQGSLGVVGGFYELETGRVSFEPARVAAEVAR
jgi:carbonic anhydrase